MAARGLLGRRNKPDLLPGELPADALTLLDRLPGDWCVITHHGRVYRSSPTFGALGLLHVGGLTSPRFADLADATLCDGQSRSDDIPIGGSDVAAPPGMLRIRTSRISDDHVLCLIDDITAATRVDAMRRDFLENVSHELKTPVGAIVLLADAAESAMDDPKALHRFISRMQQEAARMKNLINDITDLSRLQAAHLADARLLSVRRAAAEAVDAVQLAARDKRIDILRDIPQGLRVFADEEQLLTALRNLLSNAVRYSPPHTRITVRAREVEGYTEICVEDQGIGIEPEHQARIFERFHRVDPARSRQTGGTGLGLAIVKHICLSHGGEVTVQSEVAKGSTFTLRFPVPRGATSEGTNQS